MKTLPIVALIGQTNAGKSSLLNRFARKNIAIVAREEGTTRDSVSAKIDGKFLLIDTAGLKSPEDDFEASIQEQINDAIESADLILLTLDSTKYFDYRDKNIARAALRSKKPVFLVLNKSDRGETLDINEFRALGVPEEQIFRTSATTGQGTDALKRAIFSAVSRSTFLAPESKSRSSRLEYETGNFGAEPTDDDDFDSGLEKCREDTALKIALIGRPNVGKSSLFNSLGKKQQALVSSRQGTTRDVNRMEIKFKGRNLEILDTAGLRRPGKREVGIEKFSAIRTLAAIEEADICCLLVDSSEPHSKLDQSLAGQITEAGKGIIMVVTKTDLLEKAAIPTTSTEAGSRRNASATDRLLDDLERDFDFLPYAPVVLTSSETGKNVTKIFELALQIDEARRHQIKTQDLNKILHEAVLEHPPAGLKNTRPKPKYIVQTDVAPPWFVVHGHDLSLLHWSYKRFLERKIREFYPYLGTPIFFSYRSDNSRGGDSRNDGSRGGKNANRHEDFGKSNRGSKENMR